jgi:hypothetical protein
MQHIPHLLLPTHKPNVVTVALHFLRNLYSQKKFKIMKTLFKNYNSLRHFYLFILILYSCSRPSDEPLYGGTDVYYRLTEEQLKQTPYFTNPDFDTVTFISNNNDTLIFKKNYTDTSWYSVRPYFNANYYELYQNITNHYQTIKGDGTLQVTHLLQESNTLSPRIIIEFNLIKFRINPIWFSPNSPYYIGSFVIDANNYSNVFSINSIPGDTSTSLLYFNNSFGAIKIIDKTRNTNWKIIEP